MSSILKEAKSSSKYKLLWRFTQTDQADGDKFDKLEKKEFGGRVPEKLIALLSKCSTEEEFVRRAMNMDAPDEITITSNGGDWKLKKIDSTHFKMMRSDSNNWQHAMVSHVGEHRGRPYYDDIASWLRGGGNPDGKKY